MNSIQKKIILSSFLFCGCQSLGQYKAKAQSFAEFRETAPRYWSELKNSITTSPILTYQGLGVGDAHILNFNFVETSGNKLRHIAVVDFDDSYSQTSLFGDWLRFYKGADLFNQEVRSSFDSQTLWKSYVAGLENKLYQKPTWIENLESLSLQDFTQKQNKYLKKYYSNNEFTRKAGVSPLDLSAPSDVMQLFNSNQPTIENELAGFNILNKGYYIKSGGGSKNQIRFWYLLKDKSQTISIREFKHLSLKPSPVYFQNTQVLPLEDRANDLTQALAQALQNQPSRQSLKIVKSSSDLFLMREKAVKLIDCDPEESLSLNEIKSCNELLNYESYLLGQIHNANNLKYSKEILKSPDQYLNLTIHF